jgi:bifunctional UDP-N-acetylglucosamine pyrophosphorylase / glucosamine-1-phosphate N-acetyltransferase
LSSASESSASKSIAVVILAAGQGTRMKSELPKVLHEVGGKPMVIRAVETAEKLSNIPPIVVIGHGAEAVRTAVGNRAQFVIQEQQLGTAHAVLQAEAVLKGKADLVVVYYADMPLLKPETIQSLINAQKINNGPITLLTVRSPEPRGFGRIVRSADGNNVTAIVEEVECTPEQLLINELNAGAYTFDGPWLWDQLHALQPKGKGEYYLTDTVECATADGKSVIGIISDDMEEIIGVNNRVHLADANAALRRRVNTRLMLSGVTLIDPATTYISEDVIIGMDTVIFPGTHIHGKTMIGKRCEIGPNCNIRDSVIGNDCTLCASMIEESTLENHVSVGPFAHLRTGAYLAEHVHMGNFGEIKNSRLGPHTRMGHFSYIGDAQIGEDVNIGAGTITANFDGKNKNKTVVGDHAFIGSDTMLVAPVKVEADARTAAGSVVTKDVPSGYIAVGVPAQMRRIETQSNGASLTNEQGEKSE